MSASDEKIISGAVTSLVSFYQGTISKISNSISKSDYNNDIYDETFIMETIKSLNSQLLESNDKNYILNEMLFYMSMIYKPQDCRNIYEEIKIKTHFTKHGFPAICYYYKGEYQWAIDSAKKYYAITSKQEHPILLLIMANSHIAEKHYLQAENLLLKAVNIIPSVVETHRLLREVYIGLNKKECAQYENKIISILQGEKCI